MISLLMSALIQLCDTNSVPMYNGHIYTSSVFQNVVPQSYSCQPKEIQEETERSFSLCKIVTLRL